MLISLQDLHEGVPLLSHQQVEDLDKVIDLQTFEPGEHRIAEVDQFEADAREVDLQKGDQKTFPRRAQFAEEVQKVDQIAGWVVGLKRAFGSELHEVAGLVHFDFHSLQGEERATVLVECEGEKVLVKGFGEIPGIKFTVSKVPLTFWVICRSDQLKLSSSSKSNKIL